VVAIDNLITGRLSNIEDLFGERGFSFQHHDVSRYVHVAGPVDAVLHFASPASPRDYLDNPIATMKVGSLGTHNLLGLAKDKGARFFLASTSEVYGDPLAHPQPESYWGNVSGRAPERLRRGQALRQAITMAYHRSTGGRPGRAHLQHVRALPASGRRPGHPELPVAGPGRRPVTIYGDGSQTVVHPCGRRGGHPAAARVRLGGADEHGNPEEYDPRARPGLPRRDRVSSELVYEPLPGDDPKVRRPDITLAREVLGWAPHVSLREGLEHTAAWYRAELLMAGGPAPLRSR
jgi:dTDP-glucose 4,6-dehydratase